MLFIWSMNNWRNLMKEINIIPCYIHVWKEQSLQQLIFFKTKFKRMLLRLAKNISHYSFPLISSLRYMITFSSLFWNKISPSKLTWFCLRPLMRSSTSLFDIALYELNKSPKLIQTPLFSLTLPRDLIAWISCLTSL